MQEIQETKSSVNFLDFMKVIWEGRKTLAYGVGGVAVLSVIVTLLLPNWYKSTVRILPPKNPDMINPLGAASSVLKGMGSKGALGLLSQDLGPYNYLAILKSRSAMQAVVEKFNLIEVYDVSDSSLEDAIEELEDNVNFEVAEEQFIQIDVLDKEPQRAADMANYLAEVLNEISIRLGTGEARSNRAFIEARVLETRELLRVAEDSLRAYQERTHMIIPPTSDGGNGANPLAELYGEKAKKEIELGILRRSTSHDNPLAEQLEIELSEILRQISTYPEIGITSLRLYRELIINQKILEYLLPVYEQARIDEQKDVPVMLVLDRGVPAEKKDRPKRMIIVGLLVVTATVISVLLLLVLDSSQRSGLSVQLRTLFARNRL